MPPDTIATGDEVVATITPAAPVEQEDSKAEDDAAAHRVFYGTGAILFGMVAGIYWHYKIRSHVAELTAVYYNTRHRDGYIPIERMMTKHKAILNFTCMEMKDTELSDNVCCSLEGLVRQVKVVARAIGTELARKNVLEGYNTGDH
ncbi:hypothetical protein SAY87_015198 [Trapa incisa]|uniref:Beta-amylase n=1 Tax=Trapa incisa TaxID=236973 RepID=A0AAN7JL83_9MYRT|nr:hypothetical protein SAY87_015198 [Trapa incisa]